MDSTTRFTPRRSTGTAIARTASTEAASTMYSGSSANRASTSAQAAQPTADAVFSAEAKVRLVTPTSS